MFKSITLTNFRTHSSTTVELKPVTLLIGNNNSGKTNFIAGLRHFSQLARRARPDRRNYNPTVHPDDLFLHRYRLAEGAPMAISIDWANLSKREGWHRNRRGITPIGDVTYSMELYESEGRVSCSELIRIKLENDEDPTVKKNGFSKPTNRLSLRKSIESDTDLSEEQKRLAWIFFQDFAYTFAYHLQPAFMKQFSEQSIDDDREIDETRKPGIPTRLGYTGQNLQELILDIKNNEDRVFSRFIALMRRFEPSFHSIREHHKYSNRTVWEFDLRRESPEHILDDFPPSVISDGLIKASAISLLVSLKNPPALIVLEEIENGINPGNIHEIMDWIWKASHPDASGYAPQFILTSHSPAVLREFVDHLDHVYTVHLDKRFRSDVRNLNTSLETFIGVGTVDGEIDDETGLVKIPAYELSNLWYNGTIG